MGILNGSCLVVIIQVVSIWSYIMAPCRRKTLSCISVAAALRLQMDQRRTDLDSKDELEPSEWGSIEPVHAVRRSGTTWDGHWTHQTWRWLSYSAASASSPSRLRRPESALHRLWVCLASLRTPAMRRRRSRRSSSSSSSTLLCSAHKKQSGQATRTVQCRTITNVRHCSTRRTSVPDLTLIRT